MVTNRKEHSNKTPTQQGRGKASSEPDKIGAFTPYDFAGRNLTPYGGLLPVITMLEKLGFPALVKKTLTSKRVPRAMDLYRFVLGMVPGLYIGLPRLNQLRFIARDPILDERNQSGVARLSGVISAFRLLAHCLCNGPMPAFCETSLEAARSIRADGAPKEERGLD